jgi:hypothetical protein
MALPMGEAGYGNILIPPIPSRASKITPSLSEVSGSSRSSTAPTSSGEEANPLLFEKYSFDFIWILAQYDSMKFEKVLANESVELIPPLFIIATMTRNKTISNEAVRLLESIDRIEANWDSQTALRIARVLIAREECSDMSPAPQSRQIRSPTSLNTCLHNASGMWVSTDFP